MPREDRDERGASGWLSGGVEFRQNRVDLSYPLSFGGCDMLDMTIEASIEKLRQRWNYDRQTTTTINRVSVGAQSQALPFVSAGVSGAVVIRVKAERLFPELTSSILSRGTFWDYAWHKEEIAAILKKRLIETNPRVTAEVRVGAVQAHVMSLTFQPRWIEWVRFFAEADSREWTAGAEVGLDFRPPDIPQPRHTLKAMAYTAQTNPAFRRAFLVGMPLYLFLKVKGQFTLSYKTGGTF